MGLPNYFQKTSRIPYQPVDDGGSIGIEVRLTTQTDERGKTMTKLRIFGGDMGSDEMYVRCDLANASSPIEVDYRNDEDESWETTQYQCADTRHRISGLASIAMGLAARAVGVPESKFRAKIVEV
jgi:hypothetical protein